ncbi:MAG: pyruvate kinase [Desulfobulbaceae bacterium]|nr:MAG: pyruvate kinase [Desulfobulbaceae bacterium]
MNKTKIVATLGPSSQTEQQILALVEAGMNVARINLSHGDRQGHAAFIESVRNTRQKSGKHTAILLDTRGPEIRVGELGSGIDLEPGQIIRLGFSPQAPGTIPVNYHALTEDVSVGTTLLLDDGKFRLRVSEIDGEEVVAEVTVGGHLSSRKRLSLPDIEVNLPSITDQDESDIIFGVQQEVDFIAVSFVRKKQDVHAVREVIERAGGNQSIIAKIENRQGVDNLDEIIRAADGLMVARGDLGVEMPAEEVPVIQKHIINASNRAGKPVITATQMLESMIHSASPTRAEASDVTNAIFDGTDAVMLSGETAVGSYPLEAVRFLATCAQISEAALDYDSILAEGLKHRKPIVTDAISYASCATAADLSATAIVTATTSGSTALRVARYRPKTPIIAVSAHLSSLRKLQLIRGVIPLPCDPATTMDEQINNVIGAAIGAGLLVSGDLVVITAGMPLQTSGTTNMMKVRTISFGKMQGAGLGNNQSSGIIRVVRDEKDWLNPPPHPVFVVPRILADMQPHLKQAAGIICEQSLDEATSIDLITSHSLPIIGRVVDGMKLLSNGQFVTLNSESGLITYGESDPS